MYRPILQN